MWNTQVELQKRFSLGSTFTTKICRIIDANTDIYGEGCKVRKKYSPLAFAHAYENWEALERGDCDVPFEPEKYARFLIAMDRSTAEEYFDAGIRRCRDELYDQLTEFFDCTRVPKDNRTIATILRKGVLTIVTTGEVKGL